MSEDIQPDPTQSVLDSTQQPVPEARDGHIDVTYHQPEQTEEPVAEASPEPVSEPAPKDAVDATQPAHLASIDHDDGHDDHKGRVTDVSKAMVMAQAGQDFREHAATLREEHNDLKEKYEEDDKDYVELSFPNQQELSDYTNQAEIEDEHAAGLEFWAGVLYDHPVSDTYKETHQGIIFEPRALERLHDELDREDETISIMAATLREMNPGETVNGLIDPVGGDSLGTLKDEIEQCCGFDVDYYQRGQHEEFSRAYDKDASAEPRQFDPKIEGLMRKYIDLIKNPTTTLEELKTLYVEVVTVGRIEPRREDLKVRGDILNDVISGRASHNGESLEGPTESPSHKPPKP